MKEEVRLEVRIDCTTSDIRSIIRPLSEITSGEHGGAGTKDRQREKVSVDAGQQWDARTLTGGQYVQFN